MPVVKYRPTTSSRRAMNTLDFSELTKGIAPYKRLVKKLRATGGRNNSGSITCRHRGGGVKRKYRVIDFKRDKENIEGVVQAISYDPNRTCYIALIAYLDGEKSYILAPLGLKVGDRIQSSKEADIRPGNAKELSLIPIGTMVHNVETNPGEGGKFARSAGSSVQLMAKEGDYVLLRMPSGELRKVRKECKATVGQVGNLDYEQLSLGKAGRSRKLGIRPSVRGVAMNPVDHPLGGGEGKTSGGRHPVSPWGKKSKGKKTRMNKATDKYVVTRRKSRSS
jgi:large subunit ribosomal protein L2